MKTHLSTVRTKDRTKRTARRHAPNAQPFKAIQSNSKQFKDQIQHSTGSRTEMLTPVAASRKSAALSAPSSGTQTPPTTSYRAKGKIASLPEDQRELINQMLSEGSTYALVCQRMREHGVCLNAENVSNWHNGAHQDWLLHQEWREDTRTLRDDALELSDGSEPSRFNQAALHLASIQIFAALRHLPRGPLEQKLGGDSGSFARLVNALSRATRETLNAQKYLDACTQARAILQRVVKDPKRKLDQEETRAIVRAVDRVLGLNFEDEPNPTPDEPGSAADAEQSAPDAEQSTTDCPQSTLDRQSQDVAAPPSTPDSFNS